MMTDGVGCSFVCQRPKREQAPEYTPENVPIEEDTEVLGIDPGERDIMVGVRLRLDWGSVGDGQEGGSGGG
jgi:hypothetical protein